MLQWAGLEATAQRLEPAKRLINAKNLLKQLAIGASPQNW